MNRTILFVLPMYGLLVGCATIEKSDTEQCETVVSIGACDEDGDKNFPVVTLNTETMKASPENVCAIRKSTIEYRVVPPGKNDVGTVSVRAKDPLDTWLNGSNSPDEMKIEIFIPAWVETGKDYEYGIYLSNGKCIDPRVHVDD